MHANSGCCNFIAADEKISLIVKDQSGSEVLFRVRPSTRMEKVWNAYCGAKHICSTSIKFVCDGCRIRPYDTCESLRLENNDSIYCYMEQEGD